MFVEPNNHMSIIWQGQEIGELINPMPDMWYLEGIWRSNKIPAADTFESLAKALDLKQTFQSLNGIEVHLKLDEQLTRAIIIELSEKNELFLRRMVLD